MQPSDLPAIAAISAAVHREFAEPLAVYAERLLLYPAGCFVLGEPAEISGFLVSHPWRGSPPGLGAMLHTLPPDPDRYYLHDIALLPEARGSGAGAAAVHLAEAEARAAGCAAISLVAVHGAERYWARHGFEMAGAGYGPGTFLMRRPI